VDLLTLVITPNYDYDDKARSSPSFDTMMQSNVRGWRVNRFIKSGVYYVGNSGEILSGCFIFPLLWCGTLSSFLRGFGSKDAFQRSLQQHGETKKRNSAKLRRMEHPGDPEILSSAQK
jgi:hypothetical protein